MMRAKPSFVSGRSSYSMSEFVKFSAAIRHFNVQLAVIAAKHRTLEAQRGEVAALIRNTAVIGSPDVIAGPT